MRQGSVRVESGAAGPGPAVSISRHEWPGRIVLAVGCFTSLGCVAALVILWLGWMGTSVTPWCPVLACP